MLNKKETKTLCSLLKKVEKPHEGLPQQVFNALINLVPFVACEIVLKSNKGILLTYRKDKYWHGWHFPGGLLRFNESFEERIENVAWQELGVVLEKIKFLCPFNCVRGKRGHHISLVFLCETSMEPKKGKFFKKMPKNIIESHKELWNKCEKYATRIKK